MISSSRQIDSTEVEFLRKRKANVTDAHRDILILVPRTYTPICNRVPDTYAVSRTAALVCQSGISRVQPSGMRLWPSSSLMLSLFPPERPARAYLSSPYAHPVSAFTSCCCWRKKCVSLCHLVLMLSSAYEKRRCRISDTQNVFSVVYKLLNGEGD